MRSLRFWLVALLTFLLITCGAFLKKAIALTLCTILGFESFNIHPAFLEKSKAVALTPTESSLVAQDIFGGDHNNNNIRRNSEQNNIDIFSPPNPSSTSSTVDILSPPSSNNIPSQVDQPVHRTTESNENNTILNDSLDGIWVYRIYESDTAEQPFLETLVQIDQDEEETIVDVCQGDCTHLPLPQYNSHIGTPQAESLVQDYGELKLETLESVDGKSIWGRLTDITDNTSLYFLMQYISFDISQNTQGVQQTSRIKLLESKTLSTSLSNTKTQVNPAGGNFDRFIRSTSQVRGNQGSSGLDRVERIHEINPTENDQFRASQRTRAKNLSEQARRTVERLKGKTDQFIRNSDFLKKIPSPTSSSLRGSARLRNVGRVLMRTSRLGLRIAGRLALPLLILDLGLTAYEYCQGNPENCQAIADNISRALGFNRDGSLKQASSYGDPHMLTYDGYRYNFQTLGEYILTKSVDSTFEVQTRQTQVPGRQLSLNTGAAMKIGGDRIAFYVGHFPDNATDTILRVNGEPTYIDRGRSLSLASGGTIEHQGGNDYLVTWPNGEYVSVKDSSFAGMGLLDVTPHVHSDPPSQFTGLLGDLDGDPANDLRSRGGSVIPSRSTYGNVRQMVTSFVPIPGIVPLNRLENAIFDQIYKDFGNSWRVDSAESLFDYRPGEGPATFADPSFPRSYRSLENLTPEQMAEAEEVCVEAGVEPELLDGCVFDVAFTEETGFAEAAANALLDEVGDRVINEIQQRVPIPIPRLPF